MIEALARGLRVPDGVGELGRLAAGESELVLELETEAVLLGEAVLLRDDVADVVGRALRDELGEEVTAADRDFEAATEREPVGLAVDDVDFDASGELEAVTVLERDPLGLTEPVGEREIAGEEVVVREASGDAELLPLDVMAGDDDTVVDDVREMTGEAVVERLAPSEREPVGLEVTRAEADDEADSDECAVGEREALGDGDEVADLEADAVPVVEAVLEGVDAADATDEGDLTEVRETDTEAVPVLVPVGDGDSDGERVGTVVTDGLFVPEGEAVFDMLAETDGVEDLAADAVTVGLRERVGEIERVGEGEDDLEVVDVVVALAA